MEKRKKFKLRVLEASHRSLTETSELDHNSNIFSQTHEIQITICTLYVEDKDTINFWEDMTTVGSIKATPFEIQHRDVATRKNTSPPHFL